MREAFRIGSLRLLALLALNIFIYSAVVALRSIIFNDDGGVGSAAFYLAVLLTGVLLLRLLQDEDRPLYKRIVELPAVKMFTFTFNITEKTRFIAAAAVYTSLILPVAAAYLVFGRKGFFRAAFEIFVTLLLWLVLVRHRYSGFSGIMNNSAGATGFVLLAIAIEISILNSRTAHLKPYLFIAAYVYMFLFLIMRNQEDIDKNIYDRKNVEKSILPRNLRSFNTLAVIVLYSVILMLFNLKSVVLWLMDLAGRITVLFAGLLLWLSGLVFKGMEGQAGQGAQQPGFGFMAGEQAVHPVSNFIFNVTKYFVLLYLAYRLALYLLHGAPSIARAVVGFLRRVLSWNSRDGSREVQDYDDEIETVKPRKERDRRHTLKTLIRNAERSLETITDPVERVRFIYATLLVMLGAYGIPVEKSDTTLDILRKALKIQGMEKPLNAVTYVYNGVRYGSLVPGRETLSETEARYMEAVTRIRDSSTRDCKIGDSSLKSGVL